MWLCLKNKMMLFPLLSCTFRRSNSDFILNHLQCPFTLELLVGLENSPELYLNLVWDKIVLIWACEENHHAHILSVCSRQTLQWESLIFAYLCLPVWHLSSSHSLWACSSHFHLSKLLFCFCQTNSLRTMLEAVAGCRRSRRCPGGEENSGPCTKHNVTCGLFDDDAPDDHFYLLFLNNRWIIVFLLLSDWLNQRYASHPSHCRRVRCALRLQMLVSLYKICGEKWLSFERDVLVCDQQSHFKSRQDQSSVLRTSC